MDGTSCTNGGGFVSLRVRFGGPFLAIGPGNQSWSSSPWVILPCPDLDLFGLAHSVSGCRIQGQGEMSRSVHQSSGREPRTLPFFPPTPPSQHKPAVATSFLFILRVLHFAEIKSLFSCSAILISPRSFPNRIYSLCYPTYSALITAIPPIIPPSRLKRYVACPNPLSIHSDICVTNKACFTTKSHQRLVHVATTPMLLFTFLKDLPRSRARASNLILQQKHLPSIDSFDFLLY